MDHALQLVPVPIGKTLLHRCLAVCDISPDFRAPPAGTPAGDLLAAPVLGVVCVQSVDEPSGKITVLAPAAYPLPRFGGVVVGLRNGFFFPF